MHQKITEHLLSYKPISSSTVILVLAIVFVAGNIMTPASFANQDYDNSPNPALSNKDYSALTARLKDCQMLIHKWLETEKWEASGDDTGAPTSRSEAEKCYQSILSDFIGDPTYHWVD
ncbi:hypothetical protein ACMAZH_08125 [Arenicellales bacterium nBUS_45]